jgi:hypothetical protein
VFTIRDDPAGNAGEVTAEATAYQLLRAIGDSCAGAEPVDVW